MKASAKTNAVSSVHETTQQDEAGQAEPSGLFHLPGVKAGDADQEQQAHRGLQGGDDGPRAGGDRLDDVGRMNRLNAREDDPRGDERDRPARTASDSSL